MCPVSSATFQQLQKRLADASGKEVVLVSITVDPLRDTPQRLREYAARYDVVLIGEARGGKWTRIFGFPSVDDLVARIEALHLARKE